MKRKRKRRPTSQHPLLRAIRKGVVVGVDNAEGEDKVTFTLVFKDWKVERIVYMSELSG